MKEKHKYYTLHWREKKRPGNTDVIRGRFASDVADIIIAKADRHFGKRFIHWKEEVESK